MGTSKKKKQKGADPNLLARNKKAGFQYFFEETFECGIVLVGTEVKSMKERQFSFTDTHASIHDGELWLANLHITPYSHGNIHNHLPERERKLLIHREELRKLSKKVKERGYTLVPTKFYLKRGLVKVEIALAKGKKLHDKRESIKQKDLKRDDARRERWDG